MEEAPISLPRSYERTNLSVLNCAFQEAYQPNPEELSYKSTYSRNLTHQGITEKLNWFKSFSDEEDIKVTYQQTSEERRETNSYILIEHTHLSCVE